MFTCDFSNPHLCRANFRVQPGQRQRRADRLPLACQLRTQPRLQLVAAGQRLAFLTDKLMNALRQRFTFAGMVAVKGIKAGLEFARTPVCLAQPRPCRAAIIKGHGHFDTANQLIFVFIICDVKDGAVQHAIQLGITRTANAFSLMRNLALSQP